MSIPQEKKAFPSYDVLIITKDRPTDIRRALESVSAQTVAPSGIIIIDASIGNKTRDAVAVFADLHRDLKINWSKSEIASTTRQRNIGIEKAIHDITFFMDDDVVLTPGYAEKMLLTYKARPQVAAVSGFELNHATQSKYYELFCRLFLMNGKTTVRGSYIKPSGFCCINEAGANKEEFCTGCASVRRSILNEHRFDESLGSYAFMEDVDFSIPIGRKYIILRNPEAGFYHYRSPAGRISRRDRQARYIFNHYYIYRKHLAKTPLTVAAHLWSDVGLVLESVYNLFKERSPAFIIGTLQGFGQVFRHLFTGKFPS